MPRYTPTAFCLLMLMTGMLCASQSRADEASMARYRFTLNCAGCHKTDGSGVKSGGIPTLRRQMGHFLSLPEGRAFLVQVPGTSNSSLSNHEIAYTLNWMAHEFSADTLPDDFEPYTEAEVTTLRRQPLADVVGTRQRIVEALAKKGFIIE